MISVLDVKGDIVVIKVQIDKEIDLNSNDKVASPMSSVFWYLGLFVTTNTENQNSEVNKYLFCDIVQQKAINIHGK